MMHLSATVFLVGTLGLVVTAWSPPPSLLRPSAVTGTTASLSDAASCSSSSADAAAAITLPPISRRGAFRYAVGAASTVVTLTGSTLVLRPKPAHAGGGGSGAGENDPRIITRMGGLLEPYADPARGIRIMAPSGWNKFDGEPGAYDVKWQDLVDPTENIKINSTPVKSTTDSVAVLGPVQDVAQALANKRKAKLITAFERLTENILFYTFEFAIPDGTHQLLLLCVAKGKLWSLDANAKEKRWPKRDEMYRNVLGSFVPKLNPTA